MQNRPKVLLLIEQCNPDWASVPLEGYHYFHEISQLADVTLVTHARNRAALEQRQETAEIHYITENAFQAKYHQMIEHLVNNVRGKVIWQLYHVLSYPTYAAFNRKVRRQFGPRIRAGEFELVHALTPMMPRYPVAAIQDCQAKHVPFVLGPVNGGVPFPPGFQDKAKKEYVRLNFLRALGRWLLPGYAATYKKADRVLAGSTYTHDMVQQMFNLSSDRLQLFYENGISNSFTAPERLLQTEPRQIEDTQPEPAQLEPVQSELTPSGERVNLLFVGRLTPYKCADILIDAVAQMQPALRESHPLGNCRRGD